jgi:hypothetical protein
MSVVTSAYQRCRRRLQQDDFGVRLWGYLCAALFVIAITISLLGCAGAQITPGLTRGTDSPSASTFAAPSIATNGANPIAAFTVHF